MEALVDLRNSYYASEVRAALVDALKAQSQEFLDSVIIRLVVQEGADADLLEALLHEALAMCPAEVAEYWGQPCELCPHH